MFRYNRDKYILILLFVSINVFFNSCAPTTSATYLSKDIDKSKFSEIPDEIYRADDLAPDTIHVNDELYISVTTSDGAANSFNQVSGISNNVELLTYIVDEEGYIKLPYIQRMQIAGLTIKQVTDSIEHELVQYIGGNSVSVRVINHRYSVLGEVNSPGLYFFSQKSINIYQAIATANDITMFGNRKNVLIVRQNGNRVTKKYINLLDDNIITSKWYLVQPDDLIYVPPLGRKAFGMETIPYDLFFSILSSFMMIMTFLISIIYR